MCRGSTPGFDFIDAELLRDGARGALVVAGEHDDLEAERVQVRDGARGGGLDRIGDGEQARRASVDRDEDAPLALLLQLGGLRFAATSSPVTPWLCRNGAFPTSTRLAVDFAAALRRRCATRKFTTGPQRDPALGRAAHDRRGERMFALRLDAAAAASNSCSAKPAAAMMLRQARPAFGQRAGLVDHERVHLFHPLDGFRVLDEHAGLRAAADADHDRHRRGEPERARAGDDQHRDRIDDRVREPRLRPEPHPERET